jgi:hypothetical protein
VQECSMAPSTRSTSSSSRQIQSTRSSSSMSSREEGKVL